MKMVYLFKKYIFLIALTVIFCSHTVLASTNSGNNEALGRKLAKHVIKGNKHWSTTDHSKVEALNQNFTSGEEITKACLSCHVEAANQIHQTIHWTWLASGDKSDMRYGKAGYTANNFCISANAMEDKFCLKCHPGWNLKGTEGQVNCLRCHNSSGFNFNKAFSDIKGRKYVDQTKKQLQEQVKKAVADITRPERKNCGQCHFNGGGGDGVKHGDLDTSLLKPNHKLDVHMDIDGNNFPCTRCHTTKNHNIDGRVYTNPAVEDKKTLLDDDKASKIACESCHGRYPHKTNSKMNDHTSKIACQTCHIPEFARENPTKMWWDWSKAGKLKNGKRFQEDGPYGKHVYRTIKGEFRWEKNVIPEYRWYNGSVKSTLVNEVIDPTQIVKISYPMGDVNDPDARITPFKVHRGKQPYDKVHKTLLAPLVTGEHGFWVTLDMDRALLHGSKTLDLPFSGEYGYVETSYVIPITHMVAPKENALKCIQCHVREKSRLANITGLYLPGRDRLKLIDTLGWAAVFAAFAGVLLHGLGRIIMRKNKED